MPTQIHFKATPTRHPLGMGSPGNSVGKPNKGKEWSMPHEIWSAEEVNNIQASAMCNNHGRYITELARLT